MTNVDRRLVAIIATGAVVIAAVLIIVFIAVVPVPEYDELQRGQLTGYVAYQSDEDGEPSSIQIVNLESLTQVPAEVHPEFVIVGWDPDGQLVVQDWRSDRRYLLIDPNTGDETGTIEPSAVDPYAWENTLDVRHDDRTVTIGPSEAGTARFTAPETYDIHSAVALGTDHIVFVDELGRVAVTGTGEDVQPLLIASDASEWSTVAARP